ncbi:hydroxymethylbilane synthase, partial [bacterium]|nr:hydroxymethylbilane synthase [bacterium]
FNNKRLEELEKGSIIGTSSLRRKAQTLNLRPDLIVKTLRGNLDTRLKKLSKGEYAGIVAASAGVKRLNLENKISQYLPVDIFIPPAGQGALGIETRIDDEETSEIVNELNHEETRLCITAERAFLKKLEGSCRAPIAAHAVMEGSKIKLIGMVASLDGRTIIKETIKGDIINAEKIGIELGESIYNNGADKILKEILGEL